MKKSIFLLTIILIIPSLMNGQLKNGQKYNPAGIWNFEAPYAPEGFTSGKMEVSLTDKQYNASMTFTESGYVFKGEKVKFQNDSLLFSIFIEGGDISIKLKFDEAAKMSGIAVTPDGEIPLFLTREAKKD